MTSGLAHPSKQAARTAAPECGIVTPAPRLRFLRVPRLLRRRIASPPWQVGLKPGAPSGKRQGEYKSEHWGGDKSGRELFDYRESKNKTGFDR